MRRFAQVLCAVVAGSTASTFIISYIGGRQGLPLVIGGLPAEILPSVASTLSVSLLVVAVFVALARRKEQRYVSFMAGLAVFAFILTVVVVPASVFQVGFRSRILSSITPAELRQIALVVQCNLPVDGRLPGPGKNLWREEEHGKEWRALATTTRIEKLDPWMVIVKHPDSVELTWGGALVGHWGVVIDTGTETHAGDLAKGIRTFITAD